MKKLSLVYGLCALMAGPALALDQGASPTTTTTNGAGTPSIDLSETSSTTSTSGALQPSGDVLETKPVKKRRRNTRAANTGGTAGRWGVNSGSTDTGTSTNTDTNRNTLPAVPTNSPNM